MNATDQIKHKIQSDPIFKKHAINFVHLDGTVERRISTGILNAGIEIPGVMSWRDEDGIIHLSPLNNFREIFFDEIHRDMIEKIMEEREKTADAGGDRGQ